MSISEMAKQRHEQSLINSAALARQAKLLAMEKGWSYEQAVNYIAEKSPETIEYATFGELEDYEDNARAYSWQEADAILFDLTHGRMKKTGEDYQTARRAVEEDPAVLEVVKSYHDCS